MPSQPKKPSLKIAYVLDGGLEKPDGVQQYILALGAWMKSQGHSVRYLVSGKIAPGITDGISLSRSMKVISNGNRLTIPLPANRATLRQVIKDEKFDVLHVQTPYSPMMGEQLIFLSPDTTAVIGTFHIVPKNALLDVGDWILGHYCYFSARHFDKMLSVSSAAQKIAKRDFNLESDILPNVIDYERFNTAQPFQEYMGDKTTILFFGRLVPRKGCKLLLQAIKQLTDRGISNFKVIVCGTGPQAKELKNYVMHNGLEQIVEFKGFIEEKDKPRYYASADISVFPSNGGESFGIVLLEAMASGKAAVLGGDNVGYRSVLSPKPELLFDPKDVTALAGKIEELLSNEKLRADQANWAKEYSREFDVNVLCKEIEDIYIKTFAKKQLKGDNIGYA
jgi:phosphatidylinositol alpha-mannosyltransferase